MKLATSAISAWGVISLSSHSLTTGQSSLAPRPTLRERVAGSRGVSRDCLLSLFYALLSRRSRPTIVGGSPSMPRAEPGTAPPIRRGQYATICYVFRFRQKFGESGFRRKLL